MSVGEIEEKRIYIDLYDLEIITIVGQNGVFLLDFLEEAYGIDSGDEDGIFQGTVEVIPNTTTTMSVVILLVEEYINPGLIAHEAYHLVDDYIGPHYGLKKEGKAYLLDYIVKHNSLFFKEQIQKWFKECQN